MKTRNTLIAACLCAIGLSALPTQAQNNGYGYYKDIFMDSGIRLNSRHDLPVSRFLGLSIENFVSATHSPDRLTLRDTLLQREILVGCEDDFDLSLLAKAGDYAFHQTTPLQDVSLGCNKTLVIEKPEAGKWFISVFGETTVETAYGKYGTEYIGRRDMLNGVPYTLNAVLER